MVLKLFAKQQIKSSLFLLLEYIKYVNKTSALPIVIRQYHCFRKTL